MEERPTAPDAAHISRPVMDVQPRRPAAMLAINPVEATAPPAAPSPAPMAAPAPATDPASSGPVANPAPNTGTVEQAPAVSSTPAAPTQDANPMAIPGHDQKSSRAPRGAVIAAVAIAVLLAVVALLAYLKSNHKTDTAANNAKAASQQARVTGSDVTTTMKQVDDAVGGINDNTDFNPADLSDAGLGLQ